MGLPLRIPSAHYYRISGRYTFGGELFIARGTLYFFPTVDLAEQRNQSRAYLPHDLGLLVLLFMTLAQRFNSCPPVDGLWHAGISDEQFRLNADAYVGVLKKHRLEYGFTNLRLPTRVGAAEISNLSLSRSGRLSFLAQSDTHDFNVGWRKRSLVRDAFWESGLGQI